jgi:hypothetical protein
VITAGDEAAIRALVRDYVGLSASRRFPERIRYWDAEEPCPVLVPEEAPDPLVGWEALRAYWAATRGAVAGFRTDVGEILVNRLAPDHAIAVFAQRWHARMADGPLLGEERLSAEVRVAFALRRREGLWRIFAAVESHVDGIEYFRRLYRRRAEACR